MTSRSEEGGRQGDAAVGSVADEAAKLIGALQGWANESGLGRAGAATQGLVEGLLDDRHVRHDGGCSYCLHCRLTRAARAASPEVREHLADALGSLAQAAAATLRRDLDDESEPASAGRTAAGPSRIDLDD